MTAVVILFWFGICFGSFVNALVWRLYMQEQIRTKIKDKKAKTLNLKAPSSKKNVLKIDVTRGFGRAENDYSILKGRSMCPDCQHGLGFFDLIPVFSWLWLRGRCRYCKKPIHWQYLLVELIGATIFISSYLFWPGGLSSAQDWVELGVWLAVSVGLLALAVYDAKWQLLPNKILYPTALVAVLGRGIYIGLVQDNKAEALLAWGMGIVVAAGVFFVLYEISRGAWIGFGDVRLGLITGSVLAGPLESFVMIFLASILGAVVSLPTIFTSKKGLGSKVPFGPYLIASTFIVLLFGNELIDFYKEFLLI